MKKLIWGIVLSVFGVLGLAGAPQNPQGPEGSIVVGVLCIAGGGILIHCGVRYLRQRRQVADHAFRMLRSSHAIDAGELSREVGVSEFVARAILLDCQRRGLLSMRAEIV